MIEAELGGGNQCPDEFSNRSCPVLCTFQCIGDILPFIRGRPATEYAHEQLVRQGILIRELEESISQVACTCGDHAANGWIEFQEKSLVESCRESILRFSRLTSKHTPELCNPRHQTSIELQLGSLRTQSCPLGVSLASCLK